MNKFKFTPLSNNQIHRNDSDPYARTILERRQKYISLNKNFNADFKRFISAPCNSNPADREYLISKRYKSIYDIETASKGVLNDFLNWL